MGRVLGRDFYLIEGGRPCYMVLCAKNSQRDAKDANIQDRLKWREARMTMELDVHRPFAHLGRVIVKAIET